MGKVVLPGCAGGGRMLAAGLQGRGGGHVYDRGTRQGPRVGAGVGQERPTGDGGCADGVDGGGRGGRVVGY